jgi:phosphate transport system substrate-binding protein
MLKNNHKKTGKILLAIMAITLITAMFSGCLDGDEKTTLIQTGSSTVLPLAIAWAEEFLEADIQVSGGGSSHGLNALLNGEADLGDASRLMKGSDYEKVGCNANLVNDDGTAQAACNGILPTKWVIAYDVLTVVVNNDNDWATQLNYTQLYKIFTDDDPADYWDEVPGLEDAPHEEIEIYAPDEASGTYDYFFEEVIPRWGKDDQQANTRLESGDGVYHPSADDNVILNAIRQNDNAIGYFGYAYYIENPGMVIAVEIAEEGTDYEEPSMDNVANYPMSRPLHIYTDGVPEEGDIINDYLRFILGTTGQNIVPEVGYVKLELVDQSLLTAQLAKL